MKFKFLTVALIALFSISSVLTSCGKYEEGPSFTLLTKKMRVTGEWTLTTVNNDEVDALLGVETILFFDGDGIFRSNTYYDGESILQEVGTWDFNSDKTGLIINETEFMIIKLENKEMKLRILEMDLTYSKN